MVTGAAGVPIRAAANAIDSSPWRGLMLSMHGSRDAEREAGRKGNVTGGPKPGTHITADPATVEWRGAISPQIGSATGDIREGDGAGKTAMSQETCHVNGRREPPKRLD